jgi:sterol desaturase/sphingolipid hydroxylase (fatty acid hydroxylase superfamily)
VSFGGLLTVWDRVIGTYRRGDDMPRIVGVDAGAPQATGYIGALREAMRHALRSANVRPGA